MEKASLKRGIGQDWTDEQLAELSRLWAAGAPHSQIAKVFGYASEKSLSQALMILRRAERVSLPRRAPQPQNLALQRAADAREMTVERLQRRLLSVCNREGVSFIDGILDDGTSTPAGDAS